MSFACRIEELVPDGIPVDERPAYLDREILRAMQGVHWAANYAGVPTAVYWKDRDPIDDKETRQNFDIVLDYFRLPRHTRPQDAYEYLMGVLEQTIGVYESRLKQSKRDFWNPVTWLAHLVRLPITVMERAGLMNHNKSAEMVLGGYAKFVRIAVGAIIVLILLRLGVKMPWKEAFAKVVDLLMK